MADTFPRQYARTQRFTLGAPRTFTVSPDGERVVFLRSDGPEDPVNSMWVLDVSTGEEHRVADPKTLLAAHDGELPAEELARRERAREGAAGVTAYATDAAVTVAAFALEGQLFVAGLLSGAARPLAVDGPVFDPRPDPTARRLAYVSGPDLRVAELDGRSYVLAGPADHERDDVTWGSADFIAAEEMHRFRGYWWSPDGSAIAATRVDNAAVDEWVIADPANPDRPAKTVRYPAAGTTNPDVTLHVIALDGGSTEVTWDRDAFPYLAVVEWSDAGLIALVQSRDQRSTAVIEIDPTTGSSSPISEDHDDDWVELVPGTPCRLADGRLVTAADRDGARRILVDGAAVTPSDLQVRAVVGTGQGTGRDGIWFVGNLLADPLSVEVWRVDDAGDVHRMTGGEGSATAVVCGSTAVVTTATLDEHRSTSNILDGPTIDTYAAEPLVEPNVEIIRVGDLDVAVLLPHDHDGTKLPVLLDPYGGPHALRVERARRAYASSQWFADQGFAVVVCDGRGTPGRGSVWERAVANDLATAPLDDQIAALQGAAERFDVLDLTRVAIRGWSFGGFLAGLAVLRRPDVFHAAIIGAPVTDWTLYDTHYTERYLGDPAEQPDVYEANSLIPLAAKATRPMLLVHGLADDNVVAAHTLRLSTALLAAGKPHEVLPLSGVTHMTPQEVVAENLLLHQIDFLRRALPSAPVPTS